MRRSPVSAPQPAPAGYTGQGSECRLSSSRKCNSTAGRGSRSFPVCGGGASTGWGRSFQTTGCPASQRLKPAQPCTVLCISRSLPWSAAGLALLGDTDAPSFPAGSSGVSLAGPGSTAQRSLQRPGPPHYFKQDSLGEEATPSPAPREPRTQRLGRRIPPARISLGLAAPHCGPGHGLLRAVEDQASCPAGARLPPRLVPLRWELHLRKGSWCGTGCHVLSFL